MLIFFMYSTWSPSLSKNEETRLLSMLQKLVGDDREKSSDSPDDLLLCRRWGKGGISSKDRRRMRVSGSVLVNDGVWQ
jgi:hypothetical protein